MMESVRKIKEILSFRDAVSLAADSEKTLLFLRHSFRQSLKDGTHDPGLTERGMEYALECGRLLQGMEQVGFGASPRLRTMQTAGALAKGAGINAEVRTIPEIRDTAMYIEPDGLDKALDDGSVVSQVQRYFFGDGRVEGMVPRDIFASGLLQFLTGTDFGSRNTILVSHDIIVMTILKPLGIYPFSLDDWCGNIQGAYLAREKDGTWKAAYIVPDTAQREKYSLFV